MRSPPFKPPSILRFNLLAGGGSRGRRGGKRGGKRGGRVRLPCCLGRFPLFIKYAVRVIREGSENDGMLDKGRSLSDVTQEFAAIGNAESIDS